jgi:hypothetical protein
MDAGPGTESTTDTDADIDANMDIEMGRAMEWGLGMEMGWLMDTDMDTNTSIDEDVVETAKCSNPHGRRLDNLPSEILDLIGNHLDRKDIRRLRDLSNRNICDGFSHVFVSKSSFIIAKRTKSGVDETQLPPPEMYYQRRKHNTPRYHFQHTVCR